MAKPTDIIIDVRGLDRVKAQAAQLEQARQLLAQMTRERDELLGDTPTMAKQPDQSLAQAWCRILGLEANDVYSLTVRMAGGDVATVTAYITPTEEQLKEMTMAADLRTYTVAIVDKDRQTGDDR